MAEGEDESTDSGDSRSEFGVRPDGSDWIDSARTVLTAVLAVGFVVALLTTGYVAVNPPETGTPYTELFVLNESGVAADYDTNLSVGEEGTLLVGVVNEEQEPVEYHLVVRDGDRTVAEQTFELTDGESWREPIAYSFDEPGPKRLDVELYRDGPPDAGGEAYRSGRLLVLVTDDGA